MAARSQVRLRTLSRSTGKSFLFRGSPGRRKKVEEFLDEECPALLPMSLICPPLLRWPRA
eukprot:811854-Pyramimonas_sp.AAC.1